MAETPYLPSSSGFTSDNFWWPDYAEYRYKNAWTTSSSTIIQGGSTGLEYFNYYGIIYFDFAAFRTKNITHYPARIKLRLKSHTNAARTVYIHMGKGMAKDSYASGTRPTDATGTTVKTVSCAANAWCELNTTDSTWLSALINSTTTCFYINRYPTGYGNGRTSYWDTGSYWEGDGADDNGIELIIDWIPRNPVLTTPTIPPIISITTDSYTFDFSDSTDSMGYINSSNIYYDMNISLDGGTNWGSLFTSSIGISSVTVNLRTYLNLLSGQYYKNQTVKIKVQARGVYSGVTYTSGVAISAAFTINYGITPTAPTNLTVTNASPYEGESVTFTVTKPDTTNLYNSAGATMPIAYYVRLADETLLGSHLSTVLESTDNVTCTIGEITSGDDISTTVKANGVDGEGQIGAFYTGLSFSVKRFRNPSVVIVGSPLRGSGGTATVSYAVLDTGYGVSGQVNTNIRKLQYTLNGTDWIDVSSPSWSDLQGSFLIEGLEDTERYDDFAIRCWNKYPTGTTGLSDKPSSSFMLVMLEYTPAFMVWRDSSATEDEAPVGLSAQALVIGENFGAPVNKGCVAVQNGITIGGNIVPTFNQIYPVGSIYMSVVSTNPEVLFGFGTWVAWGAGRVPVGIDAGQTEFDTVEETGGAKTVQLTSANLPIGSSSRVIDATGFETGSSNSPLVSTTGNRHKYAPTQTATAHNNLQPYITCYMWKRTE